MNDFNDFLEDENYYEDDNRQRSIGRSIGILIIALLAIGLVWLFLSGSVPGLSPDLAIATKYEDTFTFGEHARYNLVVANLGDAPSVSRLTVMSTLSQATEPETVYAPDPWSCTLQAHSVTCQASGVVSSNQSLPAIEITAQLPPHKPDGSNDSLRICAAVNTLLDTDLSNNETCEIVMLQGAEVETILAADDIVIEEDSVTSDESELVESEAITETVTQPDAEVSETADSVTSGESELAESEAITETATQSNAEVSEIADDTVADDVAAEMDSVISDESELVESEAITDTATQPDVDMIEIADDTVADDVAAEMDSVISDESELAESEVVTEIVSPQEEEVTTESESNTETVETDGNENVQNTEAIVAVENEQQNEVRVQVGNSDGQPLTVAANGNVFVPIHLLPASTETILTVATLQMQYDPALLEPLVCNENPDRVWGISVCNPKYDEELGMLRVTVLSTEGISDQSRAANIEFQAIGPAGTTSPITVNVISMVDRTQQPVLYTIEDSTVVIE